MKKMTLIEFGIVFLVLVVCIAAILPNISSSIKSPPETYAESDCRLIAMAIAGYKNDHQELPGKGMKKFSGDLQKLLSGENERGKVYFESSGKFLNFCDKPYFVQFDDDYDGEIQLFDGPGGSVKGSVAVWTEIPGNTYSYSWEEE